MSTLSAYNAQDVAYIRNEYSIGVPIQTITDDLNKRGRQTPNGKPYLYGTVSLVANLCGLRRHKVKTHVKAKTITTPTNSLSELEDVLSSNLSESNKLRLIKLLSKEL